MLRTSSLGVLLLVSCTARTPSSADGSSALVLPLGIRAPTLKCTFEAPSGWTTSASPMDDHLLEVLATAPKLRGRIVVREAVEATIAEATEEQKRRTLASWGTQPDFTLLREDPIGEGRLLAYQWRPQPSAPLERHLTAVLPFASKVVLANIDDDGATDEAQLLATIGTLNCSPK